MKKLAFILFLLLLSAHLIAQTKLEKEVRIKVSKVPPPALAFIDSMDFDTKVKWYKETGVSNSSIEAKTRYNGSKYSIEFSTDGILEDVEIEVEWNDILTESRNAIAGYLNAQYEKYKIDKIQIQYLGNKNLLKYLKNGEPIEGIQINYEIVLQTRVDKTFKRFEYLFSEKGDFLNAVEIILKSTDNIEY